MATNHSHRGFTCISVSPGVYGVYHSLTKLKPKQATQIHRTESSRQVKNSAKKEETDHTSILLGPVSYSYWLLQEITFISDFSIGMSVYVTEQSQVSEVKGILKNTKGSVKENQMRRACKGTGEYFIFQHQPLLSASPPTHCLFWYYKQTHREAGSARKSLKILSKLLVTILRKGLSQENNLTEFSK